MDAGDRALAEMVMSGSVRIFVLRSRSAQNSVAKKKNSWDFHGVKLRVCYNASAESFWGATVGLPQKMDHWTSQWEFQDPKMEVLYHIRPYFGAIFPYIGLIYGRYLQFRFLEWPLDHWTVPSSHRPIPDSSSPASYVAASLRVEPRPPWPVDRCRRRKRRRCGRCRKRLGEELGMRQVTSSCLFHPSTILWMVAKYGTSWWFIPIYPINNNYRIIL